MSQTNEELQAENARLQAEVKRMRNTLDAIARADEAYALAGARDTLRIARAALDK